MLSLYEDKCSQWANIIRNHKAWVFPIIYIIFETFLKISSISAPTTENSAQHTPNHLVHSKKSKAERRVPIVPPPPRNVPPQCRRLPWLQSTSYDHGKTTRPPTRQERALSVLRSPFSVLDSPVPSLTPSSGQDSKGVARIQNGVNLRISNWRVRPDSFKNINTTKIL